MVQFMLNLALLDWTICCKKLTCSKLIDKCDRLHAAKNLVLAGVKSVTLHDEGNVELWDLSSNFIFTENDIGKNRAAACVQKLQELNNAVAVSTLTSKLSKEKLSDFQVPCFIQFTRIIIAMFPNKSYKISSWCFYNILSYF